MNDIKIHSLEIGPMQNLIHIAEDVASAKAIVFDPAWEADTILDFIKDKNLTLDKVLITHSHADHINALNEILIAQPVPVYMTKTEYEFYGKTIPKINLVQNHEKIKFGVSQIEALFTPGHTPGGACYLLNKDLICGDTLFVYGCGTTALAGGDAGDLFKSLEFLKSVLSEDTIIYPSHTYSISHTSSWDKQLTGNPFLLIDNIDDFLKFRNEIHDKLREYPMAAINQEQLDLMMT